MTCRDNFQKDLKRGERVEAKILEMVKRKYPDAYKVKGYCKEGDIYIPSKDEWIEVKYDPMSNETGNIVVEIEFNGKPSALSTTKSYRWVFYTDKELIITTPEILKKIIKDNELTPRKFVGNGDRHAKLAYLIKKYLIIDTALYVEQIKSPSKGAI